MLCPGYRVSTTQTLKSTNKLCQCLSEPLRRCGKKESRPVVRAAYGSVVLLDADIRTLLLGSFLLGSWYPASCFLGSFLLGSWYPASCFLGSWYPASCFLGSWYPASCFLGS